MDIIHPSFRNSFRIGFFRFLTRLHGSSKSDFINLYTQLCSRAFIVHKHYDKIGLSFFISALLFYSYYLLKPSLPFMPIKFEFHLPIGLHNPSNLCYLNALLQAISSNTSLVYSFRKSASQIPSKLLCRLVCLLEALRCTRKYLEQNNLLPVIHAAQIELLEELTRLVNWSSVEQQDVHELFGYLCSAAFSRPIGNTFIQNSRGLLIASDAGLLRGRVIHRASRRGCNKNTRHFSSPNSIYPANLQHHVLSSRLVCSKCNFRGAPVLQPESCLTVFLDSKLIKLKHTHSRHGDHRRAQFSLEQSLKRQFNSRELISDLFCPVCKGKGLSESNESIPKLGESTCYREYRISHLPPSLVIHVQRTNWQNHVLSMTPISSDAALPSYNKLSPYGYGSKRCEFIQFPRRLEMRNYTLANENTVTADGNETAYDSESRDIFHINSNSRRKDTKPYVLRSVIVHHGSMLQSGHFTTFRAWHGLNLSSNGEKNKMTNGTSRNLLLKINKQRRTWIHTSDSIIQECTLDDALKAQAYMLFYERDTKVMNRGRLQRLGAPSEISTMTFQCSIDESYFSSRMSDSTTSDEWIERPVDLLDLEQLEDQEELDEWNLRTGLMDDNSRAELIRHMSLLKGENE